MDKKFLLLALLILIFVAIAFFALKPKTSSQPTQQTQSQTGPNEMADATPERPAPPPPVIDPRLVNKKWVLKELNGQPIAAPVEPLQEAYIEFSDSRNRFLGHTGCNLIAGGYSFEKDSDKINLSPTISRSACLNGEAPNEAAFYKGIMNATLWSLDDNALTITAVENGEKSILVFEPAP